MSDATAGAPSKPTALKVGTLVIKRVIWLPGHAVRCGGPIDQLVRTRSKINLSLWLLLVAHAGEGGKVRASLKQLALALGFDNWEGARSTVSRSLTRLAALHLVRREKTAHNSFTLQLLDLAGWGGKYRVPYREDEGGRLEIPGELLANGWHTVLGTAGLAILLVSMREQMRQWPKYGKDGSPWMWDAAEQWLADGYGLSRSTVTKGKLVLGNFGVLDWELRRPKRHEAFVPRDRYRHSLDVLSQRPSDVERWVRVAGDDLVVRARSPRTGTILAVPDRAVLPAPSPGKVLRIRNRSP